MSLVVIKWEKEIGLEREEEEEFVTRWERDVSCEGEDVALAIEDELLWLWYHRVKWENIGLSDCLILLNYWMNEYRERRVIYTCS